MSAALWRFTVEARHKLHVGRVSSLDRLQCGSLRAAIAIVVGGGEQREVDLIWRLTLVFTAFDRREARQGSGQGQCGANDQQSSAVLRELLHKTGNLFSSLYLQLYVMLHR
ncbi:hypothetical protein E2C01_058793 [Portunus trituberculatus]|uniref:Uncharacterized protein n=1 Tax=Portunus trituberculatus TaxID=210409 RepID=A0A5B7H3P7_PORTR|nr:hypothetical protein [Portunus trituberculatus]